MQHDRSLRRLTALGGSMAVVGIALFVWFVHRAGPGEIWAGLRQVGWGLAAIVAIAGLRFAMRAIAWSWCMEQPHRLPFRHAFAAVVSGDTLGNLTPLGPLVGEPAKAAFVRPAAPLGAAVAALARENLIYTVSVAAMIAASVTALLVTFALPTAIQRAGGAAAGAAGALVVTAFLVLWRRPALISRALSLVARDTPAAQPRLDRARAVEQQVYAVAALPAAAALPVIGAETVFHALGVLEVHVTWWLMQGTPPPLLTSFILEGANRLITVVFKFVPLRLGVDEAGTGAFTQLLGYGTAPGATLAIVRKIRVLFWAAVGTVLLVRRGLTARLVLDTAGLQNPEPRGRIE